MIKRIKNIILVVLISTMLLTGCSSVTGDTVSSSENTATTITEANITTSSEIVVDKEFTANDLEVGYEASTATNISLDGGKIDISGDGAAVNDSVLTISDEGTYVITGTLTTGQIVVAAEETDKVQLVLNGVDITCTNNAPIYIKNADKVFITLKEKTVNTLTDGTTYLQTDENTVDGVIFSMIDLTLNGTGTLYVDASYKHGIISKDELVFTGGTYHITAVKDAINGKDCVKIKDGNFTINAATGNGIQSKNGEDTTTGFVYISGGTITVESSIEGIEGTAIIIEGGVFDITASDDGFNASGGDATTTATSTATAATYATADTEVITISTDSSEIADATASATVPTDRDDKMKPDGGFGGGFGGGGEIENDANCYIWVSGGTITLNAAGDGIDTNGSVYISGGNIYVSGPTENMNAGMDYNGMAQITGGSIVIAGSTGMAQGFSESSSQYSLLYNLATTSAAGTEISLTDENDKKIVAFTPEKDYQSVVISSPDLENGKTYTLQCGNQIAEITLTSVVTSNAQEGMGIMKGPGQGGMTRPGKVN